MIKLEMNKLEFNHNLPLTFLGGQDFNWDLIDGEYYGSTQEAIIRIKPVDKDILWQTYPSKDNFELIKTYLALDEPYDEILESITNYEHVSKSIDEFGRIKILKQPFDQTVLNFISSTNRNLDLIRQSRRILSQSLGKDIRVDNAKFYLYPSTEDIAQAPLKTLLEAKLGYRAPFIKSSANYLLENKLDKNIRDMDEEQTRNELMEMEGIGPKVADCILTYSLKFSNVTPIDIWGKRFLTNLYNLDPKMNYEKMRQWYKEYFNGNAAYAGQFLFEYVRKYKIK